MMCKKTVLIADDSLVVLKALESKLTSAGYQAITAADPTEALEKVRGHPPDIVIMDINFPPDIASGGLPWDGYRLLEWIRQTGSLRQADIIIITSEDIELHRDKAVAAGATAMFQKPINAKALLATIQDCLEETTPSIP